MTTTSGIASLAELLALLRDLAAGGAPNPISLGVGTPSREVRVMLDVRDDANRWAMSWTGDAPWTVGDYRMRTGWRGWDVAISWRAER